MPCSGRGARWPPSPNLVEIGWFGEITSRESIPLHSQATTWPLQLVVDDRFPRLLFASNDSPSRRVVPCMCTSVGEQSVTVEHPNCQLCESGPVVIASAHGKQRKASQRRYRHWYGWIRRRNACPLAPFSGYRSPTSQHLSYIYI
jgi:hypothetical protein